VHRPGHHRDTEEEEERLAQLPPREVQFKNGKQNIFYVANNTSATFCGCRRSRGTTAAGGVLSPTEARLAAPRGSDYTIADLMSEIQTLQNPVPATGNAIVCKPPDNTPLVCLRLGAILTEAGVKAVASMPSREEMIASIVACIGAPAAELASAIGAPAANIEPMLTRMPRPTTPAPRRPSRGWG
jgi:hypothetical protein